jgi:hypothetical protein
MLHPSSGSGFRMPSSSCFPCGGLGWDFGEVCLHPAHTPARAQGVPLRDSQLVPGQFFDLEPPSPHPLTRLDRYSRPHGYLPRFPDSKWFTI